jgi:hypothetical protein
VVGHLRLVPTLRMNGAVPLLPLFAFMTWSRKTLRCAFNLAVYHILTYLKKGIRSVDGVSKLDDSNLDSPFLKFATGPLLRYSRVSQLDFPPPPPSPPGFSCTFLSFTIIKVCSEIWLVYYIASCFMCEIELIFLYFHHVFSLL